MNGAEYLLHLFDIEGRPEDFDASACVAFKAMSDTEQMANRLLSLRVKRLDTAMRQIPVIWSRLMCSYGTLYADRKYANFTPQLHHVEELDDACTLALETIADRWMDPQLTMGTLDRQQIDGALSALVTLLKDDASLPDRLKIYVLSLVQHVRSLFERLDAGDEVDLDAVFKELLAALSIVESSSEQKNRWAEFREKYLAPIIVGLLVETPGLMLQAAPLISGLLGQ